MVFNDGPLGFAINAELGEARSAPVEFVVPGSQADQGGVKANDIVVASDMGTKNITEFLAAMNTRPRPFTIPFRRSTRPTPAVPKNAFGEHQTEATARPETRVNFCGPN